MLTKYFDYIRERFRSAYFSRLESGEWMFAPLGISSMVIRSGFKLPDEAWVETLADRYRLAFKWAIALLPITLLSIVLLPPIFRAFPISENFGFSVTVRVLAFLAVTLSPAIPIAAFYLWAMRRCRHLERVTWSSRLAIEAQVRLTAPWIAWMFFVSQLGATGIFFFLAYSFRDDPFVSIFCAVMGLVMLVLGSLGPVVAKLRRLQAQNEALEALVRERTEELRELNRTLERRVQDQVAQLERMSQLRRFLSPKVADMIVAGQLDDPLATRRREVTIVFVDLRGFTAFSETAEPEDVFGVLREYHAEIGRLVERHEGTIEQFAGDGVMIIFNDPVPLPDAALAAVHFGVELRDSVVRLAESWQKLGHKVGAGIGIAQGYATIGTIGFEGRQDYGVIGAVCNLSARLCAQAAAGQVLVSQRVHARVEDKVVAELVGELALKGIQSPVPAYNVVGMKAAQTATAGS